MAAVDLLIPRIRVLWPNAVTGAMPASANYSDTLRSLGQFLQPFEPLEIIVLEREERLEVWWRATLPHGSEKHFESFRADALRAFGRKLRGIESSGSSQLADLLRALGHELDQLNAEQVSFIEALDGFSVSARVGGSEFHRTYTRAWLLARCRSERSLRSA